MRCPWCDHCEARSPGPQLAYRAEQCLSCGACAARCASGAQIFTAGTHALHRGKCIACFACVSVCKPGALSVSGRRMSAADVVDAALEDQPLYGDAGGVTLSGGEVLMQAAFAEDILARCRVYGIRTAIESNMTCPWETAQRVVAQCDRVVVYFRHADDARHTAVLGGSNRHVLDNLQRIDKPLIVRTPVVPGFNDQPEDVAAMADLLRDCNTLRYYDLLPGVPSGAAKARQMGMTAFEKECPVPAPEVMRTLALAAQAQGVPTRIAGRALA